MQIIPLQPIPAQTVYAVLEGRNCLVEVYFKPQGAFVNVKVDRELVASGILALDMVPLAPRRETNLGGVLFFSDSRGSYPPEFSGLGDRWNLYHLSEEDYELIRK